VASIAAYYARVTTAARPMNRLVAIAMLCTLAALIVELARAEPAPWIGWSSLALAVSAIGLAGTRTVPAAVRLGTQRDAPAEQLALAHAILRQHLYCFAAIAGVLVLQLGFG
jgi:hypothetical protein